MLHCMYLPYFVYSSVDECFHLCGNNVVNNAAVNIGMPESTWVPVCSLFGYIPRCRIAGSYANSVLSILRICQTIFSSGCPLYILTNRVLGFLISTHYFLFLSFFSFFENSKDHLFQSHVCSLGNTWRGPRGGLIPAAGTSAGLAWLRRDHVPFRWLAHRADAGEQLWVTPGPRPSNLGSSPRAPHRLACAGISRKRVGPKVAFHDPTSEIIWHYFFLPHPLPSFLSFSLPFFLS